MCVEISYKDIKLEFTSGEYWESLEALLNKAKNQLDVLFETNNYKLVKIKTDLYKKMCFDKKLDIPHLSNAWFKMIEMIQHYQLIPLDKDMISLHNCELPDNFVEAVRLYCCEHNIKL